MKFSKMFINSFSNFLKFPRHSLSTKDLNDGFIIDRNSLNGDWFNVGQDIKKATKQFAIAN